MSNRSNEVAGPFVSRGSHRAAVIAFAAFVLLSVTFLSPGYIRPDSAAIYSWLRSAVLDGDLLLYNEWYSFGMLRDGVPMFKEVTATGALANHWSIGTSVVSAPFYVAALPFFPADGFSGIAGVVLALASALFGAVAVWASFDVARRWLSPQGSALTTLAVFFGTPLFWYTLRLPLGTHAAGAMCIALMVRELMADDRDGDRAALIGLLEGVAIAVRLQHFVLLPALLCFGWRRRWSMRQWLLFSAGVTVPLLPQAIAWSAVYGSPFGPLVQGASSRSSTWLPFQSNSLIDVLFTSYHGLFSWAPVTLLALAGVFLMLRTDRTRGIVLVLMFAGEWFANGVFDRYFWGGMSFGPRRFVDLTALFVIGLAFFISKGGRRVAWLSVVPCVIWSLLLSLAAMSDRLELNRDVSARDLFIAAGSALRHPFAGLQLRSPLVDSSLLQQFAAAALIVGVVTLGAFMLLRSRRGAIIAMSAFMLLVSALLVPVHIRTRNNAERERTRFAVDRELSRQGPLLDQQKLLRDELSFYEARGRTREADEVRRLLGEVRSALGEIRAR